MVPVFFPLRKRLEEEGFHYKQVKSLQPEPKPYYQALIDNRDIPYVVSPKLN